MGFRSGNSWQMEALAAEKTKRQDDILSFIRTQEAWLAEIAALRKYILNYSRTRSVYEAYWKAGYSKAPFETHREKLTLHKVAKQAFDEYGMKKIPGMKELNAEYAQLMVEKKQAYAEYRMIKEKAQELIIAEKYRGAVRGREEGNGEETR